MDKENKKNHSKQAIEKFIDIISTLRGANGCPWDLKQTHLSLKPYLIEETYEVIDAIDSQNPSLLREELGDLLLQIMLHSQIASEQKHFHFADVVDEISEKMIRRHPHVFSNTTVENAEEVLVNWEKIKAGENNKGLFDGIPSSLPALLKALRMGQKAGRVGFDWPKIEFVREKVTEELGELDQALKTNKKNEIEHELGDLLFAIVQLARHLDIDPEAAINGCCKRFLTRFEKVTASAKKDMKELIECNLEELENYWKKAKEDEHQ